MDRNKCKRGKHQLKKKSPKEKHVIIKEVAQPAKPVEM